MAPLYQDLNYDYNPYTTSRYTRSLERDPLPPLDAGLDRVGDYVARRLVPVMLGRSERPLQLVMNFGTLHLSDDQYSRRGAGGAGSNTVVYNASGCTMTMGGGGRSASFGGVDYPLGFGGRRASLVGGAGDEGGYGYGGGHGKRVGICDGCFKRQLVGVTGYCADCDLGTRERDRAGLDGVRYGSGRTPEWVRREEERERATEIERERLRELEVEKGRLRRARQREQEWARGRRFPGGLGYYGDSERDELRYATTGGDGFRYASERW